MSNTPAAPCNHGLLHLYIGDGKGKTTASVGLCCRMLGSGGRVLYAQFLKSGNSSEVAALLRLGASTMHTDQSGKFTWKMNEEEREICRKSCIQQLQACATAAQQGNYDLIVLDEVLDAVEKGFVEEQALLAIAVDHGGTELVFTGRRAGTQLREIANYISHIKAEKHPYTMGIAARQGIEY